MDASLSSSDESIHAMECDAIETVGKRRGYFLGKEQYAAYWRIRRN
jgi:hypothetical protein